MSTFLITGNTGLFTAEAIERLAREHKLIIAGTEKFYTRERNVRVYHTLPADEKFSQLFDVYSIDAVWYISGYTDGGGGSFGENQNIEKVMAECRRSKVDKVVFLSTFESQNYLKKYGRSGSFIDKEYPYSRALCAAQAEEICSYYAGRYQLKVIVLWLPYIAGRLNDKNFLGRIFWNIRKGEKVCLPFHPEDRIDFLQEEELADLLVQISEETEDDSGTYYAISGYHYTFEQLELMLKMTVPDVKVVYENFPNLAELPKYPEELRKLYGFVPMENVMENIGLYYRSFVREVVQKEGNLLGTAASWFTKAAGRAAQYIEIFFVFLLAELIARHTSDSVYFRFVDVRLLYIVVMGTMYGMRAGWIAAVLECIVLVRQYALLGVGGMLLFYNIENWIPFAVYLMTGTITGYLRNKRTDEIEFSRKEYSLLREKYLFLNDVYHGAVENKGEYKKQILGFKDSFGKIFDAVQKLDSEMSESIFLEGLGVMEEILENHSAAIYTLDSWQKFGRLAVCSASQLPRLTKSIRIEDYQEVYDVVSRGEVWRNTELKENLPMYGCGVFKGNVMVLLVTLWEAGAEQYGMNYMNIFKILCGLVQTSFIRALEYEKATEEEIYYKETNITYPERFRQILAVQEDMREAGIADYTLVRFKEREKKKLNDILTGLIRANDVVGADEDGRLYLLLLQTDQTSYQYIAKRLTAHGLEFELADKVG